MPPRNRSRSQVQWRAILPNILVFPAQTFYSVLLLSNTKPLNNFIISFCSGVEIKLKWEVNTQRKHHFSNWVRNERSGTGGLRIILSLLTQRLRKKQWMPSAGNVGMPQSPHVQQVPEPAAVASSGFPASGKGARGKQRPYLRGPAAIGSGGHRIPRARAAGGARHQTSKMNINRKEARDKKDHKAGTVRGDIPCL